MIVIESRVHVNAISGQAITAFLMNCTDADYQRWWPGTHLHFHTVQRNSDDRNNLVYMDEYIGNRRVSAHGIVTDCQPGRKLVWQLKFGVRLPFRLTLLFEDDGSGTMITHTITAGFSGLGRILDPLLCLYFTSGFRCAMDEHVKVEFPKLRDLLNADASA